MTITEIPVSIPSRRWRRVLSLVGAGEGRIEHRTNTRPPTTIFYAKSQEAAQKALEAINKRTRRKPNMDKVDNLWAFGPAVPRNASNDASTGNKR